MVENLLYSFKLLSLWCNVRFWWLDVRGTGFNSRSGNLLLATIIHQTAVFISSHSERAAIFLRHSLLLAVKNAPC